MRLTLGLGSKLWVWETSVTALSLKFSNDEDETEEPQTIDHTGTLSAHLELSPHAIIDGVPGARRFGFYGTQ